MGRKRREFVAWRGACDGGRSVDNLVLEYLREFRGTMDRMAFDLSNLKARASNHDVRTATTELEVAHLNERHDRFDRQLNRLERRLGLRDADD
jgi:hypothetical protein